MTLHFSQFENIWFFLKLQMCYKWPISLFFLKLCKTLLFPSYNSHGSLNVGFRESCLVMWITSQGKHVCVNKQSTHSNSFTLFRNAHWRKASCNEAEWKGYFCSVLGTWLSKICYFLVGIWYLTYLQEDKWLVLSG